MEYWTIIDDRHAGPFSAGELIEMGLKPESPVWTSGLPDWVEASEIEELRALLESRSNAPGSPAESAGPVGAQQPAPTPEPTPYPEMEKPADTPPGQQSPMHEPYPRQDFYGQPEPCPPQPSPAYNQPAYNQPAEPQWEWQREATIPDEPCPPAYLVWSIIVTILCCQVLGIAAIICSAQTKQAYNRGNLAKARKMSEWAQWLIIISIVLGLISLPVQLAFLGV